MKVKCYYCVNHRQQGAKHTCTKCPTKIIYGVMQEKFITPCNCYEMTLREELRRETESRFVNEPPAKREYSKRTAPAGAPNYDSDALLEFLKTPRTLKEIQKRFNLRGCEYALCFINAATFKGLIYQTDEGRGAVKYGIMEGGNNGKAEPEEFRF